MEGSLGVPKDRISYPQADAQYQVCRKLFHLAENLATMNVMRCATVLSFLFVTSSLAQASFEMLLMGDNTGNNFKVTRYDPVTRMSLGSFGLGIINHAVRDVAVDQSTNRAFVLSAGGRINAFNYNTGEWLGAGTNNSSGHNSIAYNSGSNTLTFGEGNGSGVSGGFQVLNANTLAPTGLGFPSTFVSTAPLQRPGTTNYFMHTLASFGGFNPSTRVWDANGNLLDSQFGPNAWDGANGVRDSVFSGNFMYGLVTNGTGTLDTLVSSSVTNTTMSLPSVVESFASSGTATRSIAVGHNGLLWVKVGTQLRSYHPVNGFSAANTLPGSMSDLTGMAIVVAPEPTSMFALGLGALTLLRRRRR